MRLSRRMRRDLIQIVTDGAGTYNETTGETALGADIVLWSGYGSIQDHVRMSSEGVAEVRGGVQLDINTASVYLPYDALAPDQSGYRIKNTASGRVYKPMREAFDMGGQRQMWHVVCGEPR